MHNFMGRDGFYWFFGKVVDRQDPLCLGRVRVRVYGIHPDDENLVPNDHLPWAMPIQPITSAGFSGVGRSPTGPIEGTQVFGFFADGAECQIPFVMGTVAGGLGHFALNVASNVTDALKAVGEAVAPTATLGQLSKSFVVKAGPIGQRFMKDYSLTDYQAAGILGSLGLESNGMYPDIREGGSYGPCFAYGTVLKGYGWAQWTNPRTATPGKGRMDLFIDYVKKNFNGYDITKNAATDDHNYSYLQYELKTSQKNCITKLKTTTTLEEATTSFMNTFERPKAEYAHLDRRINYANQARASMNGATVPTRSTGKNQTNG
jgi:hypothetical protein